MPAIPISSGRYRVEKRRVKPVRDRDPQSLISLYEKASVAVRTLEILLDRDYLTADMRDHLQSELDELLADMSQRGL